MSKQANKALTFVIALCMLLFSFMGTETAYAQSSDPIETIASVSDLEKIRNNPDGNFVLETDITLSGTFTPISAFSGVLDGQGYTISGLTISASSSLTSVAFVITNSGTIKNLGFKDVTITGISGNKNYWAAAIAATNAGTIEECYVTGSITGGYRSGGICAHN